MPNETEPTGFENVAAIEATVAVDEAKLAADQAALTAAQVAANPEKPWYEGLTPEQRTEAELKESARLAAQRSTQPQPEHPPVDQLHLAEPVLSDAAKINAALFERLQARRNTPPAPPPPPQPVAPAILAQTAREIAEGQRISARHAEQQAAARRPAPTRAEVAAQGTTTPVFRPADFVRSPLAPAPPSGTGA